MTARVFRWDYRQQPDMTSIAAVVTEISAAGQVFMHEVDTGADEYAWVISSAELTASRATQLYDSETGA